MISDELKQLVNKFNEQGEMNFCKETTENKILDLRKNITLSYQQKI